jgi:hypothetical protein
MSKDIEKRVQEAPKTIKVKTLLVGVAFLVAIVASFIGGWFYHVNEQARYDGSVKAEARSIVELSKESK